MPSFRCSRINTLIRWTSLSSMVIGMQVAVQGISALTGLMLVRGLPKEQYAWFTIAGSMLATLNLLSDGGVSTGMTAVGGKIHDQPASFARLLQDGFRLSFRLTILGFLLAAPFFYGLYIRVGTPPFLAIAAIFMAGFAAWPSVSILLFNVANRLHSRVKVIQLAELTGALMRLSLTGIILLGGWLVMLPALAATVISGITQAVFVRHKTQAYLRYPAQDISFLPQLRGFVRSLYANHLFFCVQAQITTWIIGWLAGVNEVADLGALGRISVLLTAITSPITYLAIPTIARIQDMKTLRQRFVMTFGAAATIAIFLVLIAWWRPIPFLWLLGTKYSHLTVELPLALAAQGVTMISALAWGLTLTRGWVKNAWFTILTTLLGFAIGASLFTLNTVAGMLLFTLVSQVPTLAFCVGTIILKLTSDHSIGTNHS